MSESGVIDLPGQGASFVGAGVAFVVDIAVSVVVSLATRPKPEAELAGLVYSLTPSCRATIVSSSGLMRTVSFQPSSVGSGLRTMPSQPTRLSNWTS